MGLHDFLSRKKAILEQEIYDKNSFPWKLNEDEKILSLCIIRSALEAFLQKKPLPPSLNRTPRFEECSSLCVAYWIKGKLRGSQIITSQALYSALIEAALKAANDFRFKPILLHELHEIRIEVTIICPIHDQLSLRERKENVIDPLKGYQVEFDNHTGWYLPEVFNVIHFSGLYDFLFSLATKKGRIQSGNVPKAKFKKFEVDDFIESEDHKRALSLYGPIIDEEPFLNHSVLSRNELEVFLKSVADQLICNQEEDGNIIPIINPLTNEAKEIDWIRLPLAAGALAMIGNQLHDENYLEAAKKSADFLSRYLYKHPSLGQYRKLLALVYYGKLLLALGRDDEAKSVAWMISEHTKSYEDEPIFNLQAISFFASFGDDPVFFNLAKKLWKKSYNTYYRKMKEKKIELALYPEALNVLYKLFFLTEDVDYEKQAREIINWYTILQRSDGSFPSVTHSLRVAHVRSTGKIFEALSLYPNECRVALSRSFTWLKKMQYTKENTYFIPQKNSEIILGGFRHDAFNHEVWVDASAHVLIGGVRLLHLLQGGKTDGKRFF